MADDPEAVSIFTLFPTLPSELRCKIIKYALPRSRFIELIFRHPEKEEIMDGLVRGFTFFAPVYIPTTPILLATKEFRAEALKFLRPLKGNAPGGPTIHVNPTRDVFHVSNHRHHPWSTPVYLKSLLQQMGGEISYLALDNAAAGFSDHGTGYMWGPRNVTHAWNDQNPEFVALENLGLKELLLVPEYLDSPRGPESCEFIDHLRIEGFRDKEAEGVREERHIPVTHMMSGYHGEKGRMYSWTWEECEAMARTWVDGGTVLWDDNGRMLEHLFKARESGAKTPKFVFGEWIYAGEHHEEWLWLYDMDIWEPELFHHQWPHLIERRDRILGGRELRGRTN